jgi:hypothetical protein
MGNLKVVVDGDPNTSKLPMDNIPSTMAFVLITYRLLKNLCLEKEERIRLGYR